jgi:hypothetical protein
MALVRSAVVWQALAEEAAKREAAAAERAEKVGTLT